MLQSLGISKTALNAAKAALEVISHNIANVGVEGYTRQRVVLNALSLTRPATPTEGFKNPPGLGVDLVDIERVNNRYLDGQLRDQFANTGYWEAAQDIVEKVERIFENPQASMQDSWLEFWKAMQDLSVNPQDSATRAAVVEKAEQFLNTVKHIYSRIEDIQNEANLHIQDYTAEVNLLLQKIASINKELLKSSSKTAFQNDLLDERERLFQQLSELIGVKFVDTEGLENGIVSLGGNTIVSKDSVTPVQLYDFGNGKYGVKVEGSSWNSNPEVAVVEGVNNPSMAIKVENLPKEETITSLQHFSTSTAQLSQYNVTSGTFFINGVVFNVEPTATISEFVKKINNANIGVEAVYTPMGRIQLIDKTGEGIELKGGSSNVLEKLGLLSRASGEVKFNINSSTEHLGVGAVLQINNRIIRITAGVNDTLEDIAKEINSNVPDVETEVIKTEDGYMFSISSKDPLKMVDIRLVSSDSGEDLLYKLGLSNIPATEVKTQPPIIEEGIPGKVNINGEEIEFWGDTVDYNGTTLKILSTGTTTITWRSFSGSGKIKALIDVRDGLLEDLKNDLDNFMKTFVEEFNKIHAQGFDLYGVSGRNFFSIDWNDPVKSVSISQDILDDYNKIAAAGFDEEVFDQTGKLVSKGSGDNSNVLKLIKLKEKKLFNNMSPEEFFRDFEAKIGIQNQANKNRYDTEKNVLDSLKKQREAVSGVNLDEELSNMIKYQKAYVAATKVISTTQSMLDALFAIV